MDKFLFLVFTTKTINNLIIIASHFGINTYKLLRRNNLLAQHFSKVSYSSIITYLNFVNYIIIFGSYLLLV